MQKIALRFALLLGLVLFIAQAQTDLFAAIVAPSSVSVTNSQPPTQAETLKALKTLARLNGFEVEDNLLAMASEFYTLPPAEGLDQAAREDLLQTRNIALWTGTIEEFLGLATILFEDSPAKAQQQKEFDRASAVLVRWEAAINAYVLSIHPGFAFLDANKLSAAQNGQSVTIAVFDVFDLDILARQRQAFPKAQIDVPVVFNRPLSLSHGNTVIDIILRIAPSVHIVPLWADAKDYTKALQYIIDHPSIDIVNMSRAFAESADHQKIEPNFKKALKTLVQSRILVKALGNSGTDLQGQVTDKRASAGLGPVNNLSSYDIKLVADTYSEGESITDEKDLLIFALNLSLFADDIALSATVPGGLTSIQTRTLGVPAEGVWSPSNAAFESGSSFAAPQIAALSALLLQAELRKSSDPVNARRAALKRLKASAEHHSHQPSEWGLGLPSGDRALGL